MIFNMENGEIKSFKDMNEIIDYISDNVSSDLGKYLDAKFTLLEDKYIRSNDIQRRLRDNYEILEDENAVLRKEIIKNEKIRREMTAC